MCPLRFAEVGNSRQHGPMRQWASGLQGAYGLQDAAGVLRILAHEQYQHVVHKRCMRLGVGLAHHLP